MHIIQVRPNDQAVSVHPDRTEILANIRSLAERVACYREDMELMPGRSNLLRLHSLPELAVELDNLFYDSNAMRDEMCKWADEGGFTIELDERLGPRILWLQGGILSSKADRAFIVIFLRRPRHRDTTDDEDKAGVPPEEPLAEGIIERPVAKEQFVQSSFRCRVGDVLLSEGGARLKPRKPGDIAARDICMLVTIHRIRWKNRTEEAGAQE